MSFVTYLFSFLLFSYLKCETTVGWPDLTRKHPLGVVHEGVVHEPPSGGGIVPAKLVLGNQRVETVVEVCGLV